MTNSLPTRIQAIRARIAAATPGPWTPSIPHKSDGDVAVLCEPNVAVACFCTQGDAELIAAAPADLAFLTAALEVAMGALECVVAHDHGKADLFDTAKNTVVHARERIEKLSGEV